MVLFSDDNLRKRFGIVWERGFGFSFCDMFKRFYMEMFRTWKIFKLDV